MEAVLQEMKQYLHGDEALICLLSEEQWLATNLDFFSADMFVEESAAHMEAAVHLLRTNHILITIRTPAQSMLKRPFVSFCHSWAKPRSQR